VMYRVFKYCVGLSIVAVLLIVFLIIAVGI
jgi:uncharacterized membrane protein YukC